MTNRIFVYGSLRPMGGAFERILGEVAVSVEDAVLRGHALYGWGLPYPFVSPDTTRAVIGSVVEVDPAHLDRVLDLIDDYEGDDYERLVVDVDISESSIKAHVYIARAGVSLREEHLVESGDWMMPF